MAGAIRKEPIGKLRHRCRIEALSASPTRDAFGAVVQVWSAEAVAWCRVEPQTVVSGEETRGSHQQADCTHKVTMRYRDGLTPKKRLVWLRGGREFVLNVVFAPPMEGVENWLEVWCKTEQ
jgi:head-tail adaptor